MTDMLERVARAIGVAVKGDKFYPFQDPEAFDFATQIAIAAIKAMSEPTPEIIEAMKANIGPLAEMWRAGVDAALSTQPKAEEIQ